MGLHTRHGEPDVVPWEYCVDESSQTGSRRPFISLDPETKVILRLPIGEVFKLASDHGNEGLEAQDDALVQALSPSRLDTI